MILWMSVVATSAFADPVCDTISPEVKDMVPVYHLSTHNGYEQWIILAKKADPSVFTGVCHYDNSGNVPQYLFFKPFLGKYNVFNTNGPSGCQSWITIALAFGDSPLDALEIDVANQFPGQSQPSPCGSPGSSSPPLCNRRGESVQYWGCKVDWSHAQVESL